jgi:V/A-type H+-transporting ATPase subunit C
MVPNKASNAVLAKARALYGRRLTDDDYKTLAGCRTMTELAGALKSLPLYAPALAEINPVFARRALLEGELSKSIFLRYAGLSQYDMSAGQSVYRYFVLCSDIDEILTWLRYLDSGHPGDYLFVLPDFFEKHTAIPLYRLAKATDTESFLRALAGTPYGKALAPLRGADPAGGILVQAEPILSGLRHQALTALATGKPKPSGTAPGMLEFVQLICDGRALEIVARMKRMHVSAGQIRKLLALDCTALPPKEWEAMITAADYAAFRRALAANAYGRALQSAGGSSIGDGIARYTYHWCTRWLRFSADPTLVMMCYLYLAKNEVKNLSHIIEGIHYGMPADSILPLLIGYSGEAA